MIGTVLLGAGVAAFTAASVPPAERTLPVLLTAAQSAMSVLTPLVGIVLVDDLRRAPGGRRVLPTVVAGLLVAIGVALLGVLAGLAAAAQRDGLGVLLLGSVLVQGVALLTGTGLGLLVPSRVMAFLATIVLPLGLWRLLGSVDALEPGRGWLTQYESARRLLSGGMTPFFWLQFAVMIAIWGIGLNVWGAARLRRSRSAS